MTRSDQPHIKRIRANITGLIKAGREHRKNCPKCKRARKLARTDLFCDTGWQWVKDLHREQRRLERALLDDGGQLRGQAALW
jgi:hypothetical protein